MCYIQVHLKKEHLHSRMAIEYSTHLAGIKWNKRENQLKITWILLYARASFFQNSHKNQAKPPCNFEAKLFLGNATTEWIFQTTKHNLNKHNIWSNTKCRFLCSFHSHQSRVNSLTHNTRQGNIVLAYLTKIHTRPKPCWVVPVENSIWDPGDKLHINCE